MEKAFIISNNPIVWQTYRQSQKINGSLRHVLIHGRNLIHQGCKLINHPLAGSIKPNETLFKSLILTGKGKAIDCQSLRLIESAIEVVDKLPVLERNWSNQVMEDFAIIDLSLLRTAIDSLPNMIILEG